MASMLLYATFFAEAATAAPTHWAKIDAFPGFTGWRGQLQHMVDSDKRFSSNHFCLVVASGPTAPPDRKFTWAYVYWREAARLYTFGQSSEAMSDLTAFKGPLDLHKDVVASEKHVGSSTYLVTRSWVRNILSHCTVAGTELTVERTR